MILRKPVVPHLILLFFLLLGLGSGCLRKGSKNHSAKVSRPQKTAILVDITVQNRAALVDELSRLKIRVFEKLDKDPTKLLGSSLDIVEIDDRGENPPALRFTFPKTRGRAKIKLKESAAMLNQKMEQYITKVGKLRKEYKRSMYMEAITRALREYDEIHLVGDLALVDHERNFEAGKFRKVVDLTPLVKKKRIELIRIPVPKQSYLNAQKIEHWWNQAFFGTSEPPIQSLLF